MGGEKCDLEAFHLVSAAAAAASKISLVAQLAQDDQQAQRHSSAMKRLGWIKPPRQQRKFEKRISPSLEEVLRLILTEVVILRNFKNCSRRMKLSKIKKTNMMNMA